MIFVTVGTQLPLDRLTRGMDDWVRDNPDTEAFAQTGAGEYTPQHMAHARTLSPEEFRSKCREAEVIVSHAGTGNVLLALELQKPVVLMPRRYALKEHRNDHQMSTVKWLEGRPGVYIAYDAGDLGAAIVAARSRSVDTGFSPYAAPELIAAIRDFIDQA